VNLEFVFIDHLFGPSSNSLVV